MTVLEVKNVSIRYMTGDFKDIGLKEYLMRRAKNNYHVREFWADRDITFSLEKGDMLGIIGTNGAGKSTLLKAISGIMEPTKGQVKRNGNIAALLELASGFDGDLTVRENTYLRGAMLGYTRKFMDETYDQIIEFAELADFQDRPFKQLSSGMKSRLAFSIASLVQPDILILDEVLSVGDGAFRQKSEAKMREIMAGGATTILVSHSVQQVRELCNKVLWLDKGEQVAFGNAGILCDIYQQYLNRRITIKQAKEWWEALNQHYDYLVVGAGLYGAVFTRKALDHGKHCLVIDRRPWIGGNLHCKVIEGITVHGYGLHIFHTTKRELWDYVNQYTEFIPYSSLYESKKDVSCTECFSEIYQGVPVLGYDVLIEKLLEGSCVLVSISYQTLFNAFPHIADKVIYSGSIDQFFRYSYGQLQYEGLRLEEQILEQSDFQGRAVVELPEQDQPPSRIVEYKHFTGQESDKTVVVWEYPAEWVLGQVAYYPVNGEKDKELYQKYRDLAESKPEVHFGGRLGTYRYLTMEETICEALADAQKLLDGNSEVSSAK